VDNSEAQAWATPVGLLTATWLLTAAAVAWWLASDTALDRFFIGVVVLVLAAFSAYGTICRPRLRADADGLTVRKLFGRQQLPWPAVAIRVNTTRRFGRSIHLLELDTGEHLVVLTRTDLGAEPQDVADRLAQLRP
jgi:hypothetical protein